ncbi:hypothetical protein Tco_0834655 [Tanacetum coccineum]
MDWGLLKLVMAKMRKIPRDSRLVTSQLAEAFSRRICGMGDMLLKQILLSFMQSGSEEDLSILMGWFELMVSGGSLVASARKVIDDNRFPEVSTQTRWIKAMPIKVNIHAIGKVRNGLFAYRLNKSGEV